MGHPLTYINHMSVNLIINRLWDHQLLITCEIVNYLSPKSCSRILHFQETIYVLATFN